MKKYYLNLSNKFKLPINSISEKFIILTKDMYEAHDALLCIGEKTYVDEKNRKKFNNQHYFKNSDEMNKIYKDLPEALENNYNFPQRFNL